MTTGFSITDNPTAGAATVLTTNFRAMMRQNSIVAGNVNWGYSNLKEWTNVYTCTGSSLGAYCYSALACVPRAVAPPHRHSLA